MIKKQQQPPMEDQLLEMQQQIGELTEALQRERADAANLRRRHDEQISGLKTMVKANVVRELLPALDNLERSLKHVPKGLEKNDYVKGVHATAKQFEKTLNDMGVHRIPTVGQVFNPRLHEAVAMEEGAGTVEVVAQELQPGYTLGNEVIRHAMVRVKMEEK
ncbi:MAG: Protein GrpE [Candidatus Saccharibacteria bacterium]|nr:Protein GrpE [Candidatus Saccharibacteria bacterium]